MKNAKLIGVLTLVLLALGGLATWDEWQTNKDQEQEKSKNKIALFKSEAISRVDYNSKSFEDSGSESAISGETATEKGQSVFFTAEKSAEQWLFTSPVAALADAQVFGSFLDSILEYSYSDVVGEGAGDLEKFGLKDPVRTITITYNEATKEGADTKAKEKNAADTASLQPKTWTLSIGAKAPVGYNVYFKTSGSEKIYMGSQHLLLSTAKTLYELREKNFVKLKSDQMTRFKYLSQGTLQVEIEKKGSGFGFVTPVGWELDEQDFRDYLATLQNLKAQSFVDRLTPELLKAKADFEIRWEHEGQNKGELAFAANQNKHWVIFANAAVEIAESDYKKLQRKADDFRSKKVFTSTSFDITRLEVDGAKYERRGGLWYQEADLARLDEEGKLRPGQTGEAPKDVAHIAALAVDLEFLKADKILQDSDPEVLTLLAKSPQHTINIGLKGSSESIKVNLFEMNNKDLFLLKHSGREMIFGVKRTSLSNMKESKAEPQPQTPQGLEDLEDPLEGDDGAFLEQDSRSEIELYTKHRQTA